MDFFGLSLQFICWSSLSRQSFQTCVHSDVTICAGAAKAACVCGQLCRPSPQAEGQLCGEMWCEQTGVVKRSVHVRETVWPHNFHISTAYVPYLEKVFSNVRQKFGRKQEDKNRRSRCKYVDMVNTCDRHSSSRSSSWNRLCGELTFYQKSA